ncbi:MAG TPA: hypothetical protein VD763_00195 [Candidatus Saccharimonadales bacterium]|nr:hypothetical protein [Candidatus Saccharimonadales bacterium]
MERDPFEGGSDVGRDLARDLGDEPPASLRDTAPDILAPIDADAPISGHTPPRASSGSPTETPEHDWGAARDLIRPAFRPIGTQGLSIEAFDRDSMAAHSMTSHSQPLLDQGPVGLPVVYTMSAGAFDIVVNGDHLLSWGIEPSELQDAAMRNLAAWSATAAWSDEVSGERRLISSDTGDGVDAVRILLPEVMAHLAQQLGPGGRVLVGIPDRHLLTAATLHADDPEFAELFAEFVVEQSGGADEPVDRRVFELVDGRLVEFAGVGAA